MPKRTAHNARTYACGQTTNARFTVGVIAVCGLGLALWGTLSGSLRSAPSLSELETIEAQKLGDPEVLEPASLLEPAE